MRRLTAPHRSVCVRGVAKELFAGIVVMLESPGGVRTDLVRRAIRTPTRR